MSLRGQGDLMFYSSHKRPSRLLYKDRILTYTVAGSLVFIMKIKRSVQGNFYYNTVETASRLIVSVTAKDIILIDVCSDYKPLLIHL